MNKYNHCQKCSKWLGFLNFFKFWQKPAICETCEDKQL